jgi:hypothetical protein
MDAKVAREIVRLHRIDLKAQLHFARGQERGRKCWMVRGARLEMIAKARLEVLVLGRPAVRPYSDYNWTPALDIE